MSTIQNVDLTEGHFELYRACIDKHYDGQIYRKDFEAVAGQFGVKASFEALHGLMKPKDKDGGDGSLKRANVDEMEGMGEAFIEDFSCFVPSIVQANLLQRANPILAEPEYKHYEAAVLFADASGFTALTEALAVKPDGAEQLCNALNGYFGKLISIVVEWGGDIVKVQSHPLPTSAAPLSLLLPSFFSPSSFLLSPPPPPPPPPPVRRRRPPLRLALQGQGRQQHVRLVHARRGLLL